MVMRKEPIPPKILKQHGILEDFYLADFADFPTKDNAGNQVPERNLILNEVYDYTQHLLNARKHGLGLFFYGSNGAGKTHLSVCVQMEAIRAGYKTQFANLAGIVKLYSKAWYNEDAAELYERRVKNRDFLVIDDVGKEYKAKNSDLSEVVFDELIRYRNNRNLPTIYTTNTSMETMVDVYGKSVVTLIEGKCQQLEMYGEAFPNFRKVKEARKIKDKLLGQ